MTPARPGCSRPPHCARTHPQPQSPQSPSWRVARGLGCLCTAPAGLRDPCQPQLPGHGIPVLPSLQSPGSVEPPVPTAPRDLGKVFPRYPEPSQGRCLLCRSAQEGNVGKSKIHPFCFGGPAHCPRLGSPHFCSRGASSAHSQERHCRKLGGI